MINKEWIQDYLGGATGACPFCGGYSLYADSAPSVDDGVAIQHMSCPDCDAEWADIYDLKALRKGEEVFEKEG